MQNVMQIATNAGHTTQNDGRTAQMTATTHLSDKYHFFFFFFEPFPKVAIQNYTSKLRRSISSFITVFYDVVARFNINS